MGKYEKSITGFHQDSEEWIQVNKKHHRSKSKSDAVFGRNIRPYPISGHSFVRFINVVNVESFEKKPNEILIGDVKLIINRAKFVKVEGRGVPVFIDPVNKSAPSSNYVEAKGMKNGRSL
nr:nucleotide-binding alpha-beta plait domain-containing protein [Tanacetum cinerariifolium]